MQVVSYKVRCGAPGCSVVGDFTAATPEEARAMALEAGWFITNESDGTDIPLCRKHPPPRAKR